jgi:hypothetical protein
MKRPRSDYRNPEQLEFEDLLAEATDICLRMRSIRRKDIVFCPLRIPGWQTTEAKRLHFAPAVLDEAWLEDRFRNLRKADTMHEVLILTATYLGEVLDLEMQDQSGTETWWTGYVGYCRGVVAAMADDDSEETQFGVFCWETAAAILEAYEQRHTVSDWELLERLESVIGQGQAFVQNPEDRKTHISDILAGCLCYLHGWAGEKSRTGSVEDLI